jgi:hypothetical protein
VLAPEAPARAVALDQRRQVAAVCGVVTRLCQTKSGPRRGVPVGRVDDGRQNRHAVSRGELDDLVGAGEVGRDPAGTVHESALARGHLGPARIRLRHRPAEHRPDASHAVRVHYPELTRLRHAVLPSEHGPVDVRADEAARHGRSRQRAARRQRRGDQRDRGREDYRSKPSHVRRECKHAGLALCRIHSRR